MAAAPGRSTRRRPKDAGIETAATRLVALVRGTPGVQLLRSGGKSYITVPVGGHRETYVMGGKSFAAWLDYLYYAEAKKPAPASALADACRSLAAQAMYDGEEAPVHRRVGAENDRLYIDLVDEDWSAVQIGLDGWTVEPHRVKFVRSANMLPLPVPCRSGSVDELWRFVNAGEGAEGAANRPLILAWLVQAMLPTGPYPVLVLHGEQGSAKSFAARVLRSLVDPSRSPVRAMHANDRDLMISTRHNHVLAFDNVSFLSASQSDALCRLSTGGGYATRQLHSDAEEEIFDAIRPVILNGINELASQSDLLSRCLPVELPRITQRRPESELWRDFEEARPRILGALCDGLAAGLARLPQVVALTDSRLVDFDRWAQATEHGLDMPAGGFVAAFAGAQAQADRMALEASPVAVAVQDFMATRVRWEGSAQDLLDELEEGDSEIRRRPRWPKAASALGRQLTRLAPNLREVGIEVDRVHSGKTMWVLRRGESSISAVPPVHGVESYSEGLDGTARLERPWTAGDGDAEDAGGTGRTAADGRSDRREAPIRDHMDGTEGTDGSDSSSEKEEQRRIARVPAAAEVARGG
jgi:putative DNA primase/helicase